MSIRSDKWIRRMATEHGMIEPFEADQVRAVEDDLQLECVNLVGINADGTPKMGIAGRIKSRKVISYGTSSYGYDMRIGEEFKVFTPARCVEIDPKNLAPDALVDVTEDVRRRGYCLIPPNSFALGVSVEKFRIPRDVLAIVVGKSTYARCGIQCNVTPLEPEWVGHVTLEISNTSPCPARVYANEGIAQVLFFGADEVCETSYADRKGKYQNQPNEVVPPR